MNSSKSILITGSAGFIGSHLMDYLIDQEENLVGIDNFCDFYSPNIKQDNSKKHYLSKNCKIYNLDLLNYEALKKFL